MAVGKAVFGTKRLWSRIPDFGFLIPDSGFRIPDSGFWEGYCYFDIWISLAGQKIADLFIRFSAAFLNPETSELYAGWRTSELIAVWRFLNSTQFGNFRAHRSLETTELFAVRRLPNSTQSGDFRTLRSLETFELIAVLRLPCSSQFWDFRAFRSLEVSVLFAVLRLLNSSQSGDFCALPYGHKREKNREKVQNHPEARGKYGAEQLRMGIKHRKSVKKSKITRKPERNTEPSRRKWT